MQYSYADAPNLITTSPKPRLAWPRNGEHHHGRDDHRSAGRTWCVDGAGTSCTTRCSTNAGAANAIEIQHVDSGGPTTRLWKGQLEAGGVKPDENGD